MKTWFLTFLLASCFLLARGGSLASPSPTLLSTADTLTVKIADAGIARPVPGLAIRLQNETTGESRKLAYEPGTMIIRVALNPEHRYTVAIDAPGYTPYRKYIAKVLPNQEIGVQLQKKQPEVVGKRYILIVMDKDQRSVVPNAEVKVFSGETSLEVRADNGRYLVMLPDEGSFQFAVTAKEYFPLEGTIKRSEAGVVELGLTRRKVPLETQTVAFIAQDAFTKKPIAARFWLKGPETSPTATVTTAVNPQFGTELKLKQPYSLQVESNGYANYLAPIKVDSPEAEPVTPRIVLMEPLAYKVVFTVMDAVKMTNLEPTTLKISESGKVLDLQNTYNRMALLANLAPGKKYDVRVAQPGYEIFERTLPFDRPTNGNDLVKTILLTPVKPTAKPAVAPVSPPKVPSPPTPAPAPAATDETVFENLDVGKAVRLDNVYFDQSSYLLRPESYPQLDKLVKTLKVNPRLKIEIAGHTDNVGDARLNQYLSENRAKVISSYLTNQGISDSRLIWKGYGQTKPVAPNDTEENKAQNRRVEFVVLEK